MPKNPYWHRFFCSKCGKGKGIKYQNKKNAIFWMRKEGWTIGKEKTFCPECKKG